jgi:hypothetical protein
LAVLTLLAERGHLLRVGQRRREVVRVKVAPGRQVLESDLLSAFDRSAAGAKVFARRTWGVNVMSIILGDLGQIWAKRLASCSKTNVFFFAALFLFSHVITEIDYTTFIGDTTFSPFYILVTCFKNCVF